MRPRRRDRTTTRSLATELEAKRRDPTQWEEKAVQADIRPARAVVTSVRLPIAEFAAIQKAARESGQTVSDFIRGAVTMRLRQAVRISAVQISTGSSSNAPSNATFLAPELEAGTTRNPGPVIIQARSFRSTPV
jgi:hypothetical protein